MSSKNIEYIKLFPLLLFVFFLLLPFGLFFTSLSIFKLFYYVIFSYLAYKLVVFLLFSLLGILKSNKSKYIDYLKISQAISGKSLPHHLIAIAIYTEKYETIVATLQSILDLDYPANKIHVSLSFEDRAIRENPEYSKTIDKIIQFTKNKDVEFAVTVHPENLENEVPGAASNKKWAVKSYIKNLDSKQIENYILTIPDADTIFSKKYLANVTYKWLKSAKRHRIFIQPAVYKFQNNYTKIRSFTRIISTTLTLSILSSSTYRPKTRYTFSCFSLSLKTIIEADFWLTKIAIDDTPFYWRPYTLFDGDWHCEVVYSQISVNSIYEKSFVQNIRSQYKQFYRWGWGIIAFPIGIKAIYSNIKIGRIKKIRDTAILFENMILAKTAFVSFSICSILFTYNSDVLTKEIFGANIVAVLVPVSFLLRTLIIPYENLYTFIAKLAEDMIFLLPIGIINLLAFAYLPYLHAAIDYAKKHKHYEKITWSEKN